MSTKRRSRGRPPKDRSERKDVDLRIPVTAEQKELVMEAASLDHSDMATWVRPILLQAAQARLSQLRPEAGGQK